MKKQKGLSPKINRIMILVGQVHYYCLSSLAKLHYYLELDLIFRGICEFGSRFITFFNMRFAVRIAFGQWMAL